MKIYLKRISKGSLNTFLDLNNVHCNFKIFELLRIYETVLTKYFQFNIYESLKLYLQQNMGKGKCHPTFCCRIIAQNRTWYARDKRRCGSTWQVIWTNVSSIPRTPGLQAPEHWPDDANLPLAHSHRSVIFLIPCCTPQTKHQQPTALLLCCIGKGLWEPRWFLEKYKKGGYFWYDLWAATRSRHFCIWEKTNLETELSWNSSLS